MGINLLICFFENINKSHLIFQEQVHERLKKTLKNNKKHEQTTVRCILIDNMLTISEGKPGMNSGFPLILALMNIVSISYDLIYMRPKKQDTKKQRNATILLERQQKKFDQIVNDKFNGNLYHGLTSFIYHSIMIFLLIWRNGQSRTQMHLKDVKKALYKKRNKQFTFSVVFLYKELY